MILDIITPEKTLFSSDNATSVVCPGIDGSFQIMNNHSALISALKKGTIIVSNGTDSDLKFEISSGLFECNKNRVNILVEE